MKRRGFFICVEGLDGCGKTTQAELLAKRLRASHNAVYTAEPSRGKVGMFIRENYLSVRNRGSSVVETLLFAADRFEHVKTRVKAALAEGKLVVSDRYMYSSLAYQGSTGLDLEWIERVNKYALRPDLALFIDVEPETAVQRLKSKRSVMENLETLRKVREVYLRFVEKGDLVVIDGNSPIEKVADEVLSVVLRFLEKVC